MFPYSLNNFCGFFRMYMTSQAIEEKLKKPDCTLNELLDEEEIIQEMKSGNAKLLNFFDKEKVKKLIEYIVVEPSEDEFKRGHKYPFMSCELLNCDIPKILDFFTLTESQRMERDRKTSSVDSDLGISDSINSNSENTWFDKRDDLYKKAQTEENADNTDEKKNAEEKTDPPATNEYESQKNDQIDENACEVINVDSSEKKDNAEAQVDVQDENEKSDETKTAITTNPETENTNLGTKTGEETDNIELLDYLLSFLDTDNQLNYVLAGYFSKIMQALLSKQQKSIVTYIYSQRPHILDRFVQHIEMRSICDVFPKLIFSDNSFNQEINFANSIADFEKIRNETLTKLFRKLNLTMPIEAINNLVNACIEMLENRSFLEFVVSDRNILSHIFENLALNLNAPENSHLSPYNYKEILILLLNILKDSIIEGIKIPHIAKKAAEDAQKEEQDEFINSLFGEFILEHLGKILSNFEIVENQTGQLDTTFGVSTRTIGITRIRIIEFVHLIFSYFKNCPDVLDTIVVASNFFKHGLDYLYEFEWNNQYQHDFTNLLKYLFANVSNHSILIKYLFEELKLLNSLMEHANERNFLFNSNRKINNGYFAYLIEISHKISLVTDEKMTVYFDAEWKAFTKERVSTWLNMFNRKLCYEEKSSNIFNTSIEIKQEEQPSNTQENNDFGTEEKNETNNEGWFDSIGGGKDDKVNINYDEMGGFDFTDDHHEEVDIDTYIKGSENLKVDELDNGNYNDLNFWKFKADSEATDHLASCLNDLEI